MTKEESDTLGFALATSSGVTSLMATLNCGSVDHSNREERIIEDVDSRIVSLIYDWEVFKEHYNDERQ